MRSSSKLLAAVAALCVVVPGSLMAQDRADERERAVQAYLRGAAEHFDTSLEEVMILAEWRLPPEEMPVILFMAREAGVSSDAVLSMRRSGRSWSEVADRFRLRPGVLFPRGIGSAPLPGLARALEAHRANSEGGWSQVSLTDQEVISLVNIGFLSEFLGVPPARVLQARDQAGNFVGAYLALVRGR